LGIDATVSKGWFMKHARLSRFWLFIVLTALIWGCGEKPQLIEQKCSTCHLASLVYEKKRPIQEWDRILFGMKIRGLKVTVEEEKAIRETLSERYSEK
jgi:hypothetical protein